MNTLRTVLAAILVVLTTAAHADVTLVRQTLTPNSVFGGTAKEISTISIKGGKTRMEERDTHTQDGQERVFGGLLSITDSDSKEGYFIDPFNHTYNVYTYHPRMIVTPAMKAAPPATVTPLADTKTFLGHLCRGYHIVKLNPTAFDTTVTADVYVATDLPPVDVFSQYRGPIWMAADALSQIGGTPLHMEMVQTKRDGRQVTDIVDVTSFSTKPVRDKVFSLPKGYTLVPLPPPPAAYKPPAEQNKPQPAP